MRRLIHFGAGPAALPIEALERARDEMLDAGGHGLSVLEMSHRSPAYDAIHEEALSLLRRLLGLGERHRVLLLQGGGNLQFAMAPMNLLRGDERADYLVTGAWAKKALAEARIVAGDRARQAATSEPAGFRRLPRAEEFDLDPAAAYVHLTSNNTIHGTEWHEFPDTGRVPLVADMSSDLLGRVFDPAPFGLIYAGAQKNLGPAGVTVVIVRDDVLERCREDLPSYLSYRVHAAKNSLFNTPPCFAVYMMRNVLLHVTAMGGVEAAEKRNRAKADRLYGCIDRLSDFYRATAEVPEHRSRMNATFRLPSEDLERRFVEEARDHGMIGLKGHRSVGGIRVSMYNAVSERDVATLVEFMDEFAT